MLWTVLIPVGSLLIVGRLDFEEPIVPKKRQWTAILGICLAAGCFLRTLPLSRTALEETLLSMILGCLLFAGITDLYIGKAYHFIWWLGMTAGAVLFLVGSSRAGSYQTVVAALSFLAFAGLQQIFFAGFYGRADCHAFCVCALAESSFGMGMEDFFVHMVLAFGLLTVVQGIHGNIGKYGRLKEPVPFLPYITVSFLIMLWAA
ncbi:MAG: hypothetical protein NC251_07110 [Lachnoclostridium sp.]|nr:hypothetical protein [Lachnospira sp.]MCM1248181.1 hypothetical protein [Lachnoclostridium sp.]